MMQTPNNDAELTRQRLTQIGNFQHGLWSSDLGTVFPGGYVKIISIFDGEDGLTVLLQSEGRIAAFEFRHCSEAPASFAEIDDVSSKSSGIVIELALPEQLRPQNLLKHNLAALQLIDKTTARVLPKTLLKIWAEHRSTHSSEFGVACDVDDLAIKAKDLLEEKYGCIKSLDETNITSNFLELLGISSSPRSQEVAVVEHQIRLKWSEHSSACLLLTDAKGRPVELEILSFFSKQESRYLVFRPTLEAREDQEPRFFVLLLNSNGSLSSLSDKTLVELGSRLVRSCFIQTPATVQECEALLGPLPQRREIDVLIMQAYSELV